MLVLSHRSPAVTVTVPFPVTGLGPVACESKCGKETVQSVKELSSPGRVSCRELLRCCDRGVTAALSPWGAGGARGSETSR